MLRLSPDSVDQSKLTELLAPCHTLLCLHYWSRHNWEVLAVHPPRQPIKQQLEFCRAIEDKNHSQCEAFTQLHHIIPWGIINSGQQRCCVDQHEKGKKKIPLKTPNAIWFNSTGCTKTASDMSCDPRVDHINTNDDKCRCVCPWTQENPCVITVLWKKQKKPTKPQQTRNPSWAWPDGWSDPANAQTTSSWNGGAHSWFNYSNRNDGIVSHGSVVFTLQQRGPRVHIRCSGLIGRFNNEGENCLVVVTVFCVFRWLPVWVLLLFCQLLMWRPIETEYCLIQTPAETFCCNDCTHTLTWKWRWIVKKTASTCLKGDTPRDKVHAIPSICLLCLSLGINNKSP